MAASKELEPFKDVLIKQIPMKIGEPIPMKVYEIDHPKNCGNPWIGSYSKHGFWYKFYNGERADYEKVVALSYESDRYYLNYESFERLKNDFNFRFIVAKNQSDDILGSIGVMTYNEFVQIGFYYVVENYRHSGIGTKLLREVLTNISHKKVLFHSLNHLANKCARKGLREICGWTFIDCKIENGNGFLELKRLHKKNECIVKKLQTLNEDEWTKLIAYDKKICGIQREKWLKNWLGSELFDSVVVFIDGHVTGFGSLREVAGGYVRRILVGPLYANDFSSTNTILFTLLKKYYNPEKDYEWDPDIYAIYRRTVNFIVPIDNKTMEDLLLILKGANGNLHKERLYYVSCCSHELPPVKFEKIFAVSDLHMSVI